MKDNQFDRQKVYNSAREERLRLRFQYSSFQENHYCYWFIDDSDGTRYIIMRNKSYPPSFWEPHWLDCLAAGDTSILDCRYGPSAGVMNILAKRHNFPLRSPLTQRDCWRARWGTVSTMWRYTPGYLLTHDAIIDLFGGAIILNQARQKRHIGILNTSCLPESWGRNQEDTF